jgi:ABC-2 type transport system ATP-binding protein
VRARGALVVAIAALLLAAPAAHARDAEVSSFDGTKIVLSFFPAEGLESGKRAPTVLVGHGWSQSRETNQNAEGLDAFGHVGVGPLRRAGYNVLTWDARGFGRSGGTVQVDSPDFEARDVQALLDYVADQPESQLDSPGDPRVGMSGASYGGGIQYVTAARDSRVDVIAPDIAWNSLISALFKDRAVKSGWGSVLFGAGNAGGLAPGLVGGETGTLDPHILSAYSTGLATGTTSDEDLAWFDARGPRHLLDRIRIPTFILQGTADTLFTLQEAIDNYAALRHNGIPLKMMWFCGGHGACLTGQGEAGRLQKTVIAWFDRYLKRDASVDTGAKFEWIADDAQWRTADRFPVPAGPTLTGDGAGTLPLAQTTDSGQAQIAATPAANAVNVAITAPTRDAQVLGAPKLELTYSGSGASTAPRDHVYAQIVDTRSGRVLGNQATPIPVTLDGTVRSIERPLEPVVAAATADSRYQLQLVASTGVYGPQRADGAITFSRVRIEIPTVDPSAVAEAGGERRLRVGSVFGRLPRGRRLRVAVSASPATTVVVRLRDGRRRVLGRSKATRVGRRTVVTVKLTRRLRRPGTYELEATGTGVGAGRSVRLR